MTKEEKEAVLHCLRAMIDEELCEECPLYGTTGTDHCEKDCVRLAIEELEQEPCEDAISREAVIEHICESRDCYKDECKGRLYKRCHSLEWVYELPPVNPQKPICPSAGVDCEDCPAYEKRPNKWIPIKTRPLTNKEKEEYADLGYSEDSIDSMYDCPLPDDGEEVLITTRYDEVTTDTFYRDEGCYFETYCDKDDVKAWMPLPKPYKAEGSGE